MTVRVKKVSAPLTLTSLLISICLCSDQWRFIYKKMSEQLNKWGINDEQRDWIQTDEQSWSVNKKMNWSLSLAVVREMRHVVHGLQRNQWNKFTCCIETNKLCRSWCFFFFFSVLSVRSKLFSWKQSFGVDFPRGFSKWGEALCRSNIRWWTSHLACWSHCGGVKAEDNSNCMRRVHPQSNRSLFGHFTSQSLLRKASHIISHNHDPKRSWSSFSPAVNFRYRVTPPFGEFLERPVLSL